MFKGGKRDVRSTIANEVYPRLVIASYSSSL